MTASIVNSLNTISGSWARYMTGALIDAAVGFALAACIWFAIRRRLPARWGYVLFLFVPLKLLVPIQAPLLPIDFRSHERAEANASPVAPMRVERTTSGYNLRSSPNPNVGKEGAGNRTTSAAVVGQEMVSAARTETPSPSLSTFLMFGWTVIVAFLLVRFFHNQRNVNRYARRATPISVETHGVDFRQLCRRTGVRNQVQVCASDTLAVPAIVGLFHPRILIPRRLLQSLTSDQLSCILAHELAHLRWHDLWIACAERIVRIFHFANPALWLASHFAHVQREIACDDVARALPDVDRKVCGSTLLDVLRNQSLCCARPTRGSM